MDLTSRLAENSFAPWRCKLTSEAGPWLLSFPSVFDSIEQWRKDHSATAVASVLGPGTLARDSTHYHCAQQGNGGPQP